MDETTAGMTTAEPVRGYISETVLEDAATHPAYMNIMFWTAVMVGALGLLSIVGMFVLAWNDKPIPDGMGAALQWALLILGVLLVGEALLGKVTVNRA
jgi:hypothetical protein